MTEDQSNCDDNLNCILSIDKQYNGNKQTCNN